MNDDARSPLEDPTLPCQRDALRKGKGRAVLWAKRHCLDRELLREACLNDWRYDRQCESYRGDWLWSLIEAAGLRAELRESILTAARDAEHDAAGQLQELAGHYAIHGDAAFTECLRQLVVERPKDPDRGDGEDDLIRAEGLSGFVFVAHHRGLRLADEPWNWRHDCLMDQAIESWGRDVVIDSLKATSLAGAAAFLKAWPGDVDRPKPATDQSYAETMQAITVEEILADARSKDRQRRVRFRGWGMHASDVDLQRVLDVMAVENDSDVLKRLLQVFSNRAMPAFRADLLRLLDHDDHMLRSFAASAIAQNSDAMIRAAALRYLDRPDHTAMALALFVRNFEPGDETRLVAAIDRISDCDDMHCALMDANRIIEHDERCDSQLLGMTAYEGTPCSLCRTAAAKRMIERGTLPDWVREELPYDVDDEFHAAVPSVGP